MIDWMLFNTYLGKFDKTQILVVIDDFLNTCSEKMLNLRNAVSEKDYSTVDQIAHPLKTNCRWFGATVAADLAYELELMGKRQLEDKMAETFAKLSVALEALVRELKEYRNALDA